MNSVRIRISIPSSTRRVRCRRCVRRSRRRRARRSRTPSSACSRTRRWRGVDGRLDHHSGVEQDRVHAAVPRSHLAQHGRRDRLRGDCRRQRLGRWDAGLVRRRRAVPEIRAVPAQRGESRLRQREQYRRAAVGRAISPLPQQRHAGAAGVAAEMLRVARSDSSIGIVGIKQLFPYTNIIYHTGIVFAAGGVPQHLYPHLDASLPQVNKEREYQAVTGACLLIERPLFEACHGFDEAYVNGYEDVDLCMQVRRQRPEDRLLHERVHLSLRPDLGGTHVSRRSATPRCLRANGPGRSRQTRTSTWPGIDRRCHALRDRRLPRIRASPTIASIWPTTSGREARSRGSTPSSRCR